ncbi:MAG: cupin domain-containing protein [Gammaproteobacteria bacterium]|nr:cupin domain-containing protein [Gammaproteobacteria bacterium]
MDFDNLISPLDRSEFMTRYRAGDCFVIRGDQEKFSQLISLADIERRLNDGCNLNQPPQIIMDGLRQPLMDSKVAWSSTAAKKTEILRRLETGHSFMMTNLSQINPAISVLIDGIEEALAVDDMRADLHLYVSTRGSATAYNAHRDYPQHKIYLQVIGITEWHVYHHSPDLGNDIRAVDAENESDYLEEAACFELNPGDLFYMPPAVFHKIRNTGGPRVSLSIPIAPAGGKRMDRTYIPFERLFREGAEAGNRVSEDPGQGGSDLPG